MTIMRDITASIAEIRRGLRVERMHTKFHHSSYTNGHHSANAAMIAYYLCLLNSVLNESISKVLLYMLLHDVAESYVGDIPANAKVEHPALKQVLDTIERDWCILHKIPLPELNEGEKIICKCADLIELGYFCIEEINLGNNHVHEVLENVVDYLESRTHVNGVEYFRDLIKNYGRKQ